MKNTIRIRCFENAFSDNENIVEVLNMQLPVDEDGCASLSEIEVNLPDGRSLIVNAEVQDASYGLGCYTNTPDVRDTKRLIGVHCTGELHAFFMFDVNTEISIDLI